MRFGLQMFGLTPLFNKDKKSFLSTTSALGYRYIEPCVSGSDIPAISEHLWSLSELEDNYNLLKEYGFSIYSIHFLTQDVLSELSVIADICAKYNIKQVIVPTPSVISKEVFSDGAQKLIKASVLLEEAGVDLLIHNSEDNSVGRIDGISAYEWMLKECDGAIGAQVDVGWLLYGGIDPEKFLWDNKEYVESLHYKDFEGAPGSYTETAVGTGLVDMMACFQFARYEEIIQYVDQDSTKCDMFDDLKNAMAQFGALSQGRENSRSTLCIMDIETGTVTELKTFDYVIEAPNWYQQDDNFMFYNSDGHIFRYDIASGESIMLESGNCIHCNNDHVISPDGKWIAVSHSDSGWESKIYIFPIEGGEPRLITPNYPSFLHGWSPDGKELAYCAFRMHEKEMCVDVYSISSEGGEEKQLTKNAGFNDGPEYSPDGEYILYISTQTGLMQNWRMKKDGSEPVQLTFTDRNNWFGHYSPNGQKIVYLSYSKDGLDPTEHLPNMQVQLCLMNADGSDDHVILDFFGGQGSINVNSWNPDSKRFAFVKYDLIHK